MGDWLLILSIVVLITGAAQFVGHEWFDARLSGGMSARSRGLIQAFVGVGMLATWVATTFGSAAQA